MLVLNHGLGAWMRADWGGVVEILTSFVNRYPTCRLKERCSPPLLEPFLCPISPQEHASAPHSFAVMLMMPPIRDLAIRTTIARHAAYAADEKSRLGSMRSSPAPCRSTTARPAWAACCRMKARF